MAKPIRNEISTFHQALGFCWAERQTKKPINGKNTTNTVIGLICVKNSRKSDLNRRMDFHHHAG